MINVKLISGNRVRIQKALIDTGADYILINSSITKDLNIDLKSGIKLFTTGIENRPIETYFHDLDIEIDSLKDSRFSTKVGFIDSPSVGILLGQHGFFDNFIVKFEKYSSCFSIDKRP